MTERADKQHRPPNPPGKSCFPSSRQTPANDPKPALQLRGDGRSVSSLQEPAKTLDFSLAKVIGSIGTRPIAATPHPEGGRPAHWSPRNPVSQLFSKEHQGTPANPGIQQREFPVLVQSLEPRPSPKGLPDISYQPEKTAETRDLSRIHASNSSRADAAVAQRKPDLKRVLYVENQTDVGDVEPTHMEGVPAALIQRALIRSRTGQRAEQEEMGLVTQRNVRLGDHLQDQETNAWYRCRLIHNGTLLVTRDNNTAWSYNIGSATLQPLAQVADGQELLRVIRQINDAATLMGLFARGATGANLLVLFQFENNGATLDNLIQTIHGNSVADLIRLYVDGAITAQIQTLLNSETNGATLHGLISAIDGHNVAHVLQLYQDGADTLQIQTLLNSETNGATLHGLIQAITGHSIPHLLQLYNDGASSAQIRTLLGFQTDGLILHQMLQNVQGNDPDKLIELFREGPRKTKKGAGWGALIGGAIGAVAGGLIGGILGSIIPGLGTAVGVAIGAIVGALAGGLIGAGIGALIGYFKKGVLTSAQVQALVGFEHNTDTLITMINDIRGRNADHLIQLYNDGATTVQIQTLLGHESNGATLHGLITGINGNNVAHLIQLFNDGASSAQIQAALPHENNGVTLHTYMPLILRQNADGVAINAAMIQNISRQRGTLTELDNIQSANAGQNLHWSQQAVTLQDTAFGRWLLNGGPQPNPTTGDMNCWEVVLFGAFRAGYVNQVWLTNFYQAMTTSLQNAGGGVMNNTFYERRLRVGGTRTYDATDVNSPRPMPGDVVVFRTAVSHTSLAIGNMVGSPQVLSLWNTPGNHLFLQRTDVAALLGAGANAPVKFFSPRWG